MKQLIWVGWGLLCILYQNNALACVDLLDVRVTRLGEDQPVHLCEAYKNEVVLVVNTASKCGFTNQYDGLEALYERYKKQGFVVLGFPSNDFGQQEPGTEKQIKDFCRLTYGVKFPMFAKTRVKADDPAPLFRKLGGEAGEYPQWNFHKYLINRDGKLVKSFASRVEPGSPELVNLIEQLL